LDGAASPMTLQGRAVYKSLPCG